MSIDGSERIRDGMDRRGVLRWAAHQNDGKAEPTRRFELAGRGAAAAVFGDHNRDAMFAHQTLFVVHGKRPARFDERGIVQAMLVADGVDGADDVMVLRHIRECRELQATDGEKRALRQRSQGAGGGWHVRHLEPSVAVACDPGSARQPDERNTSLLAGQPGVAGHLRGERVGGIDQQVDMSCDEMSGQPRYATKPADAGRDRQIPRPHSASRQRQCRVDPGANRDGARQGRGLTRSAENQNAQ